MGDQEREVTDLIDVSDVARQFEEGAPDQEPSVTAVSEPQPEDKTGFMLASLKDRLAAAIIDGFVLYCFYWIFLLAYRTVAFGEALGPIPGNGWHGIIFHSLFLFFGFFYFFVFEGIFYASIGKIACRMSLRDTTGEPASLSGIFLRNLLRPIDLILFPIAIGIVILEKSGWHQRLGDFAGKTVVIRKLGAHGRQYALTLDMMASASGRLAAFLIDVIFFGGLAFGLCLLLNPDQPLMSMLLVIAMPVIFLLFYLLPEAFSNTSIGKLIFGYTICQEDGATLDVSSAVIRTASRIVDSNFFGFLCVLLSIRKQRPGDVAAATVLCRVPRQLKGLISSIVTAAVVVIILITGLNNRNSFLAGSFQINFLPMIDFRKGGLGGLTSKTIQNLIVPQFSFSAGSIEQKRRPAIFQPGETLFLVFNVDGFEVRDGKVWIQEDLLVRYPDDSIGLKLENVIDFHQAVAQEGPIEFTNNIALPEGALPGRYTVTLTLRDQNSGRQLKEQRFFYVTPAGTTPKTPEEEKPALPPAPPTPPKPEEPPAGPRTIIPPTS
jgi:uncharacterized RDD family membrane protein YckC